MLGLLRVLAHLPSLDQAPRIERRADRIADPVERLRYLRKEMAKPPKVIAAPVQRQWKIAGFRHLAWVALAIAMMVAPSPAPTGAAETSVRERNLLVPRATAENAPAPARRVWRVERSETTEVYSNGLHVDLTFAVSNRPRASFPIYPLAGDLSHVKTGSAPAGIVYHTTESHLAPFEEESNRRLRQLGRNLLEVVRSQRSYHYVIDRFGRVYSVVAETDAANHAGNSVWADAEGIYVNLNDSFLGVSFEGQTGAADEVTPAQIASARMLTEMLRSRYGIAASNCVTHAQVSVNPLNMRVGAHTDWASDFPFAAVGLPDNYSIPLASVYAFGFDYDSLFLRGMSKPWKGLALATEQVEKQARLEGATPARYRAMLQHRYKDIAAALKEEKGAGQI
jgi:N-acetylmuramoyl-L-alanine amidase